MSVNPITPRKYNVLSGNYVFDLCNFFRNITLTYLYMDFEYCLGKIHILTYSPSCK